MLLASLSFTFTTAPQKGTNQLVSARFLRNNTYILITWASHIFVFLSTILEIPYHFTQAQNRKHLPNTFHHLAR